MTFVLEVKIDSGNGNNHIPPRHKCCFMLQVAHFKVYVKFDSM